MKRVFIFSIFLLAAFLTFKYFFNSKADLPIGNDASLEDVFNVANEDEKPEELVSERTLNWYVDFEKAKEAAQVSGKLILMDFTGSDWCGWCIKLKQEVFNQDEFIEYANGTFVLMEVDFPRAINEQDTATIAQNNDLMDRYGVRGFPTIMIVNSSGEVMGRTGYLKGGPTIYIQHLVDLLGQ
tara:strand:- start:20 stop:568 length:549 start_codon:yes stop_codon:yes gene_type:complete